MVCVSEDMEGVGECVPARGFVVAAIAVEVGGIEGWMCAVVNLRKMAVQRGREVYRIPRYVVLQRVMMGIVDDGWADGDGGGVGRGSMHNCKDAPVFGNLPGS